MTGRIPLLFVVTVWCLTVTRTLTSDLANIGPYMSPAPGNPTYFPPGVQWFSYEWDHVLNGTFPTHGDVNVFFFRDNTTKMIANCVRTMGGKKAKLTDVYTFSNNDGGKVKKSQSQTSTIADIYYCFAGNTERVQNTGWAVPLAAFVNDIDRIRNAPADDQGGTLTEPRVSSTYTSAVTKQQWTNPVPYLELLLARKRPSPSVMNGQSFCVEDVRFGVFNSWSISVAPEIGCMEGRDGANHLTDTLHLCGTRVIPYLTNQPVDLFGADPAVLLSGRYSVVHDCIAEKDATSTADDGSGNCKSYVNNEDCVYRFTTFSNFRGQCMLSADAIHVDCLDMLRPSLITTTSNRNTHLAHLTSTELGNFFQPEAFTHGSLRYLPWRTPSPQLEMKFWWPDSLLSSNGYYPASEGERRSFWSQADIWSLPWTHAALSSTAGDFIYDSPNAVTQRTDWTNYAVNEIYRADPSNVYFMNCPMPTRSNPGVDVTQACNSHSGNFNTCDFTRGRCFCDKRWLGIACDIPRPVLSGGSLAGYQTLVLDPSDPYEICSTAGALVDTGTFAYPISSSASSTLSNVPVCRCIAGFEGSPLDFKSFVPVYASMFHQELVDVYERRAGGAVKTNYVDRSKWFSHNTYTDFRAAHEIIDMYQTPPTTAPNNKFGLANDWYDFVMTHQCLIWTRPRTMPPQHVWWDYYSAPFIAAVTSSLGSFSYEAATNLFPWPSISTTRRNATSLSRNNTAADGRQGIRCMDYREFDWDTLGNNDLNGGTSSFYVARYVQWLQTNSKFWLATPGADGFSVIPKAKLYGGPFCTPCPDCNRSNSVCVEGDPVSYTCDCNPATETCTVTQTTKGICPGTSSSGCKSCTPACPTGCTMGIIPPFGRIGCLQVLTSYHKTCTQPGPNVCKCDENFCGPTCDVPMCPVPAGSTKICGNGTCTINPATNCENLSPGQYGGVCKCDPGYTGVDCSTPTCPFFSSIDGSQCGNGTCNDEAGKCECNVGWTGNACDTPACPFDPNTNLECAGAVRADNGQSVCNRATQKCECFRTIALNLGSVVSGWIGTDLTPFVNGRYGVACEKVFGRACRDPQDGTWCGQPLQANGNFDGPLVAGYAGCYNETCVTKQLGGEECTPYCHCTLEFAVPQNTYCRKSVCGPEYCGFPKGKCNPHCSSARGPQPDNTCTSTAVLAGNLTLTPTCDCQVFNGTFYYHKHDDPDLTVPCTDPAPLCYTPATGNRPCNGHGDCAYNVTSDSHFCMCDAGYSGANCSTAPSCFTPVTGAACIGPTRSCSHDLGHNNAAICACNSSYFRDPDRNCTLERCVSTGGVIDSDGECSCPNNTALYSDPPLSRTDLNHVALGCRKKCPVSPFDGIECGAYMYPSNTVSRCSDLYPTKNPIFGGDARPAPTCVCDFLGLDHKGQLNYFINASDFATSGMCEPKCNPDGLCKGDDCLPSGSPVGLAFPFECHCSPLYQGDRCEQIKCDQDHSHHTGGGQCQCHTWCRVGANCDVDLCAPSGGVCQAGLSDCDCSSTSNVLRVDSSNGRITNRNCTSACQNGGILSDDKQSCICVGNFFGTRCEKQRGCNPQWKGPSCNVSNCFNGGTPKPNVNDTGCVCADAFYAGVLCDQDLCIVANRRNRTGVSTCVCAWSFTGDSCQVDPCSPGGSLSLLTGQCQCNQGWVLASNLTACLLPSAAGVDFYCDPDHGTVFNRSDGTQACICDSDYIGLNCSVPRCTAPLQGPYCMCPAGSYAPPSCDEDYCNSAAIGYNATTQRCVCPVGYVLSNDVDASGTLQCVPDAHYCNYLGTVGWNNVSNHIPCICEEGWSGPTCSSFDSSTTDDTASDDPVLSRNAMIAIAAATFLVVTLGIAGWIIYVKCIRDPLPTLLTQPSVNVTASKHWRSLNNDAKSAETNQWTRLRTNSDDDNNNDDDDNE